MLKSKPGTPQFSDDDNKEVGSSAESIPPLVVADVWTAC
jgi:hypothetical protein